MENSRGLQYFANVFSWPQYVFKEESRGQLAEAKLMGYEGQIVKLISWKVVGDKGACSNFAMTMMKFGWKNTGLDERIKDWSRCLVRTARFKSEVEWEDRLIVLILVIW